MLTFDDKILLLIEYNFSYNFFSFTLIWCERRRGGDDSLFKKNAPLSISRHHDTLVSVSMDSEQKPSSLQPSDERTNGRTRRGRIQPNSNNYASPSRGCVNQSISIFIWNSP